ncbi:MAG: hypothetical protein HRU35_06670 [Rickettsiaceae bacterium]|nr:hypothetical protein [Rickettsiaceae bacterium]
MKNNDLKDKLSDKGIGDLKNFYQELEPEKQVKFLKALDALVDEARNNIDIDLALLFEDEFEYDDLENYLEDEKDISEYNLTEEKQNLL